MKQIQNISLLKSMRYALKLPLYVYKLFISPMLPQSCRFYPTCSHYARLVISYQNPLLILPQILYRILRCQPFAKSGIDYPIIWIKCKPIYSHPKNIAVWLVPLSKTYFLSRGLFILIPSFRSFNEKR